MNHFFRRNQKKFLAVFAALLMVVFILPSTCGQGGGGSEEVVVAYAGDEKIYASELIQAKADWTMLQNTRSFLPMTAARQLQIDPRMPVPLTYQLGFIAMSIEQSPELFLLLQKEAERSGIAVPPDRIDNVLREMNLSPNITAQENNQWRQAVEAFLKVKALYDRVTSNVKVSEPVVARYLAQVSQEPQVNLVEFDADPAAAPTTAPTTQELESHFQKYANRPAGLPSTNPAQLTFGYQRPDRVKVQYLTVRKDQVREAVRKSKDPYDWEVAARRYYMSHQRDFPVTQPATLPSTTQATQPTTAAATRPATTRPFEEVREQVMERVTEPEVEKLTAQISDAIAQRLAADWEKQRPRDGAGRAAATGPTTAGTQPATTGPAATSPSTQPSGLAAFAYLEQVAADVQKQFGVLPSVTSKSDQWLSAEELGALQGIGRARRAAGGESFANYVIQSAEPLMPLPEKADPAAVLSLLEPSQPIKDLEGNVYVFRVTDAQAAHAPQSLAELREQVEADVRAARTFEKTMEAARKLLEAAKKDRLAAAAAASGKQMITTGPIGRGMFGMPPTTIPSYPTTPETRQALVAQAGELLSQATPDAPHPLTLVEVPEERKVLVAELAGVTSRLPADEAYATRIGVSQQMAFQQAQELAAEWFTPDAVKARLKYRSLDDDSSGSDEASKTASAS